MPVPAGKIIMTCLGLTRFVGLIQALNKHFLHGHRLSRVSFLVLHGKELAVMFQPASEGLKLPNNFRTSHLMAGKSYSPGIPRSSYMEELTPASAFSDHSELAFLDHLNPITQARCILELEVACMLVHLFLQLRQHPRQRVRRHGFID